MDLRMGLYLMSLLNMVFGSPEASYSINLNKLSFEDAQNYCKPGSFLTNLKNKEEITKIQKAIWDKTNKATTLFWIGLKKKKGQCVYQNKPLKGFHWTVDNREYLHDIRWKEEPLGTCTDERCGLLSVEYSDSETKISGLANAACKQKYAFICKRNMDVTCPSPFILGTHDIIETPNDPFTRHVICSSGAEFTLVCSNDLTWNIVGNENSDTDVSQLCLQCKSGYRRDASGNCVDINECEPFSPCKHSCLNTDGSYKCVCSDNEQHADDCGESTTPTTHLKNYNVDPTYSNVNIIESDLVQPHDGSVNETSVHSEEHSEDIANIVVPVIIALLILVVLLVIIAAIVKGCMRRQSVKRAQRKAEAVALSGSSSTEKVNENEVHKRVGDCTLL